MHVSDIFDMIGGTSIGSITASALSIPDQNNASTPKYYAQDIVNIYTTKADILFQESFVDVWKQYLVYSVSIV